MALVKRWSEWSEPFWMSRADRNRWRRGDVPLPMRTQPRRCGNVNVSGLLRRRCYWRWWERERFYDWERRVEGRPQR